MIEAEFVQIALILLLAALAGGVAHLLKQPLIVAYIVVGVAAGPSVFGIVSSAGEVELLAKVGIAILLFLVGLKLDINLIRSTGVVALLTGVGQVVFTSVIGYFIIIALGFDPLPAIYIAVALTFSSTIIIVKLLSDKRELDMLHGRIAVGFLIVQDLLVIVAMILIVAIGQPSDESITGQVVRTFLSGFVFLAAVALIAKFVLPRTLDWLTRNQELTLLFSVAWAVSLGAASFALGLSLEVGAFIAGVALASTPYRESIGARLVSLRDIMILFFFISLGAELNFTNAFGQLYPAIILSLFVLFGNPIIVMIIMGLMGYRSMVSFKAGLAVAQISEFSLILIALGYSLNQVNEDVLSLVTMVGVITITISTYFILYSDQIYRKIGKYLKIFEIKKPTKGLDDDTADNPYDVIVVGGGRLGGDIVKGLRLLGAEILVVDYDPQALRKVRGDGVETLYGDVSEPEFAEALPINEAAHIICAVPDTTTNAVLLEVLKRLGYRGQITLTAMDDDSARLLGNDKNVKIIRPFKTAAASIIAELSSPIKKRK
jgi:Kef-type K+ transport system membrane component KefB